MTDLVLYNGFTPLRRSPGDLFLDNGLGLLRAHLRKQEIDFLVEDNLTAAGYADFEVPELSRPLRAAFQRQIFGSPPGQAQTEKEGAPGATGRLYTELVRTLADRMQTYHSNLTDRVRDLKPAVFGIKLWFGSTFQYAAELCQRIREASPETVVVVGGPQANCFYPDGLILRHTDYDLAVYSEGEEALTRVVRIAREQRTRRQRLAALEGAAIPNLVQRGAAGIQVTAPKPLPIDGKPFPEYSPQELAGKMRSHTLIDGLGCDYGKCTFCAHPTIFPHFQLREPRLVVDEMEQMVRQGIGFFTFTASDTPLPHARRISEEILKRRLNVEYTLLTRAFKGAAKRTGWLVETYRKAIAAGMRTIWVGAESGHEAVLREVLHKNIAYADIAATVACIRDASRLEGCPVYILNSYIFPLPLTPSLQRAGLTLEQVYRENLRLAGETRPDSCQVIPALVYPGTPWYRHPEAYGISFDRETYAPALMRSEISVHALVDPSQIPPYSFLDRPIREWLPLHRQMCNDINALGIPTDLNDEHVLMARCAGPLDGEALQALSRNLFLDLVSCCGARTRQHLEQVNRKSLEIARSNGPVG